MADQLARIDRSKLYLPFSNKLPILVDACAARGLHYIATSGYRSVEDQNKLFSQGRVHAKDGRWVVVGPVVTKARGGSSYHNFGLATDFVLDKDPDAQGVQISWTPADYRILAEEAVKLGLEAGYNFKSFQDPPHIQFSLAKYTIPLQTLLLVYNKRKLLPDVFAYLDKYQW